MAKIENKKQTANCEHDYRIRGMDRVRSGMRVTLKCELCGDVDERMQKASRR